jgi:hypothetical protein
VELNLPNTLTAIGCNAFAGCSGLVELNLPDIVTAIGDVAFGKCTNLRCLVLPPALISLAATAFEDSMINLRMLVVLLTVPPQRRRFSAAKMNQTSGLTLTTLNVTFLKRLTFQSTQISSWCLHQTLLWLAWAGSLPRWPP